MGLLADADGADFAAALVERAIRAGADEVQAGHVSLLRFELDADTTGIKLAATNRDDTAVLTVFRNGRRGSAALTGRDETAINAAIRHALDSAGASRPDPAYGVAAVGWAPPSRRGPDFPDRDGMIDALRRLLEDVRKRFPPVRIRHANYSFEDRCRSFANSAGTHRQERRAIYRFWITFGGKDGIRSTSFNATGSSACEPFERLIDAGGAEALIGDTMRSFDPRPVASKFTGDVIATPNCTAYLAAVLAGSLNGYALMGGLTPYADRAGERIANSGFGLLNRPADPRIPEGSDFDDCGVPTCNVDVIRDGVLQDFLIDFFCSRKLGRTQNAGTYNLVVPPGERSAADLIRETERGIVLGRFSGGAPARNLDFSGVAKNSFYVEDGRIRYPLIETMVRGNLQELMMNVRGLSREAVHFGAGSAPYMAASGVTISPP